MFIEDSEGSSEDLQNTLRTKLQTSHVSSRFSSSESRKSLQFHICMMFKQIFKRTSSSQLAKESQIEKIKCFRKKLLLFPEKSQNQPEQPPKRENEGECFAPYTCKTLRMFIEDSKGFSEDLQNTFRTKLQTSYVSSRFSSFESRKSLQVYICMMLKQSLNAPLHLSLQKTLRLRALSL